MQSLDTECHAPCVATTACIASCVTLSVDHLCDVALDTRQTAHGAGFCRDSLVHSHDCTEYAVHRLRDEPEDMRGKCTALPRKQCNQSLIIVARASVDEGYRRYDAHDCMHMQVT